MKPIHQTKIINKEGTITGNCFRACLASILEINIDSIPEFENMKAGEWHQPFMNFLNENGYEFEGTGHIHRLEMLKTYEGVDGYIIVNGISPRKWVKRGHSVVYKDGILVHDPHPSGDGLLEIKDFYLIKRK